MEKSPLTWDYLESGFAREVSGTCQPKHWEARALPLGDTRISKLQDSILKTFPVYVNLELFASLDKTIVFPNKNSFKYPYGIIF